MAKMEGKLRKLWERTIGMRLAFWLDKRNPEWCWVELFTHVGLGWGVLGWREAVTSVDICKRDCARNGICWCGKRKCAECGGVYEHKTLDCGKAGQ